MPGYKMKCEVEIHIRAENEDDAISKTFSYLLRTPTKKVLEAAPVFWIDADIVECAVFSDLEMMPPKPFLLLRDEEEA